MRLTPRQHDEVRRLLADERADDYGEPEQPSSAAVAFIAACFLVLAVGIGALVLNIAHRVYGWLYAGG